MNLRGIKYVVRRGDGFQLRLPIPKDLQEQVQRKELRWSLRTENRRVAAQRAFRAGLVFLELCDTLRKMQDISELKIRRMVQAFYNSLCDAYAVEVYPSSQRAAHQQNNSAAAAEEVIASLLEQVYTRSYSDRIIMDAEKAAAQFGIDLSKLSEMRRHQVLEGIARAYVEQAGYIEHRRTDFFKPYTPSDDLFLPVDQGEEKPLNGALQLSAMAETTPYPSIAVSSMDAGNHLADPKRTIGQLANQFLEVGKTVGTTAKGKWRDTTYGEYSRILSWFVELVGAETDVVAISSEHVRGMRDGVVRLRKKASGKLSFKDAQTTNSAEHINVKTARKYFGYAKSFLVWLRDEDYIKDIPADSLKVKTSTQMKSSKRRPFTEEEIVRLFSSPMFMGCISAEKRRVPGPLKIKDDKFWMPLLGFYTGARPGELIMLPRDRAYVDNPYPHLLLEHEEQKLKTAQSERIVPLHPDLEQLGFFDFVRKRQKQKVARLFEYASSSTVGKYADAYSKFINRYMDHLGLNDPELVAYGFRHYFIDGARNAGIEESNYQRIVGHSTGSKVTSGYGKGPSLEKLHGMVASIDMKIPPDLRQRLASDKSYPLAE